MMGAILPYLNLICNSTGDGESTVLNGLCDWSWTPNFELFDLEPKVGKQIAYKVYK